MSGLASLFNSLYTSFGYSATYDPFTDLLSLDQPIGNYETLFTQNTDSGLELDPVLDIITPEPASVVLVVTGLLVIGLARNSLWRFRQADGRGTGALVRNRCGSRRRAAARSAARTSVA